MAKISKLKTGKSSGPPPEHNAPENTAKTPRDKTEATKPLQFRVPQSIFDEFSLMAGQEFGFSKGSKLALFRQMFEEYKRMKP